MLRQQRTSASGGTKKIDNRLVTPQLDVQQVKQTPQTQPTFDAQSNHGRHAQVKCPIDSCGYEGRSDNVKRHVKRKHPQTIVVPQVPHQVPPTLEAPKDNRGASSQQCNEYSFVSTKSLQKKESREMKSKKNAISPYGKLVKKNRATNGFKTQRVLSDKSKPKEKKLLTKARQAKKKMTMSHKSRPSHEIIQAESDIDSSKQEIVLFDIDNDRDQVQSMSQVVVNMSGEAQIQDQCFSEALLKPRCLHFSESPSSFNQQEETKKSEAPSILHEGLSKAFLTMLGKRARLDLQMQVTKAKVDQLNGDLGGQLLIPDDICGDFTIVRYFNKEQISATSMNGNQVSRVRRIINKDIEANSIEAPNHSQASNIDDFNITVTEEDEDSDYVSTLRDPNEEL